MIMKSSRRTFLKNTSLLAAALPLANFPLSSAEKAAPSIMPNAMPEKIQTKITVFPLVHGGIKPVHHDRLGTVINAQTAVATLRFYRMARVDRLEIPPTIYGRGAPGVPVHPAHLLISIFNRRTDRWETIRDLELPANPKFSGKGLNLEMPMADMEKFFVQAIKEHGVYSIDLGGIETDHLRLECDREHPIWPNHGECNGNVHNVPFGIFRDVSVYGEPLGKKAAVAPYHPVLQHGVVAPVAPVGMEAKTDGRMVLFRGSRLSVGFSVNRPILLHLGWDDLGEGRADLNRLLVTRTFAGSAARIVLPAGLSGPVLRTLDFDIGSHLWTGRFEVQGNEVRYLDLQATKDLRLNVIFRVEADRLQMEIEEICPQAFTAIEYEAWRFAWDVKPSPTGVSGVPSLRPGRNGHVPLPVYLSGEGSGCLALRRSTGSNGTLAGTHLQVESYRECEALTCGIVPVERSGDGFGVVVPTGTRKTSFELAVTNLQPRRSDSATVPLSPGIRRSWATMFSCYRPEHRGFSNNCVSINCHLGQWSQLEVLAHTQQPENGPDLSAMHRFTVEKAVLDGGGYGYWREFYMDSAPALLCAAGTSYRLDPKRDWLQRIRPGLVEIYRGMVAMSGENGLLVNKSLSGNSGEFTHSTNGIDTVCFGYLDAYSNAWAYRALRNVAPLFAELGDRDLAAQATDIADRMRRSYGPTFINPQTGWVAGWRSRDGKLHDYAYIVINGIAIAFGLLDADTARKALVGLEERRRQVCPVSPQLGLPINLIPHADEDHYFPQFIRGSQPTYELFTDGAVSSNLMEYYLRALSEYGFKEEARRLADDFDRGFADGMFSGGVGSGNEMRSWEGLPSGYEGTLTYNHGLIYSVAVEKGFITPQVPEWWPAMPSA